MAHPGLKSFTMNTYDSGIEAVNGKVFCSGALREASEFAQEMIVQHDVYELFGDGIVTVYLDGTCEKVGKPK